MEKQQKQPSRDLIEAKRHQGKKHLCCALGVLKHLRFPEEANAQQDEGKEKPQKMGLELFFFFRDPQKIMFFLLTLVGVFVVSLFLFLVFLVVWRGFVCFESAAKIETQLGLGLGLSSWCVVLML